MVNWESQSKSFQAHKRNGAYQAQETGREGRKKNVRQRQTALHTQQKKIGGKKFSKNKRSS
jgi:hypothetical protein